MARLAISPRTAVVVAVAVLVVGGIVAVLTSRASGAGGVTTVSSAPEVVSSTGPGPGSGPGPRPGVDGAGGVPSSSASPRGATSVVMVHVVGAVGKPGLVRVTGGARVSDAVGAAGGAAGDADLARVNLARVVVDGERLYVPRIGETEIPATVDGVGVPGSGGPSAGGGGGAAGGAGAAGAAGASGGSGGTVDLNTADAAALDALPGIGPAIAERIVAWRAEHGRFTSVDDLMDVSGIGPAKFAELRDLVRV